MKKQTIPGTRIAPAETGSRAQGADGGLRGHGRGEEEAPGGVRRVKGSA